MMRKCLLVSFLVVSSLHADPFLISSTVLGAAGSALGVAAAVYAKEGKDNAPNNGDTSTVQESLEATLVTSSISSALMLGAVISGLAGLAYPNSNTAAVAFASVGGLFSFMSAISSLVGYLKEDQDNYHSDFLTTPMAISVAGFAASLASAILYGCLFCAMPDTGSSTEPNAV